MTPDKIESVHPLSPMQQGILFQALYDPGAGLYVPQVLIRLRRPVQVHLLERAWQAVAERHAVLRTCLRWKGVAEPVQEVHRRVHLPCDVCDVRLLPEPVRWKAWTRYLDNVRRDGFDPPRPPLLRIGVFRFTDVDSWLAFSFFHVISDGWSVSILIEEVFSLYDAYVRGEECTLKERRPYWDYVQWLRERDYSADEAFWRKTLAGFRSPVSLPDDAPSNSRAGQEEMAALLAEGTARSLRHLADLHGLTLNTLLQGAWALLLSRISGSDDVVFGASRACRRGGLEGAEDMIGLFTNTVPVRAQIDPDAMLLPWLRELRAQWSAVRPHEHASAAQMREWSGFPAGTHLFDTIVNPQFGASDWATLLGRKGSILEDAESEQISLSHYALSLQAKAIPELKLAIAYDRGRFHDATIGRMLGQLGTLLAGMAADPHRRLSELPWLSETDRHLVLLEWSRSHQVSPRAAAALDSDATTIADHASTPCIHELFEARVARTPDAVALVCPPGGRIHRR